MPIPLEFNLIQVIKAKWPQAEYLNCQVRGDGHIFLDVRRHPVGRLSNEADNPCYFTSGGTLEYLLAAISAAPGPFEPRPLTE